jgi:hypothetical protein
VFLVSRRREAKACGDAASTAPPVSPACPVIRPRAPGASLGDEADGDVAPERHQDGDVRHHLAGRDGEGGNGEQEKDRARGLPGSPAGAGHAPA